MNRCQIVCYANHRANLHKMHDEIYFRYQEALAQLAIGKGQ